MIMGVKTILVAGIDESIIASGYPMVTNIEDAEFSLERAKRLGSAPSGSGHDTFLKGCKVWFDVIAPVYWWPQLQRYGHIDFISSQSSMHKITEMDFDEIFSCDVSERSRQAADEAVDCYENEMWIIDELMANMPQGQLKGARLVTNYLQLKTIYNQRKGHKLKMWREEFCPWILTLPRFVELTGVK